MLDYRGMRQLLRAQLITVEGLPDPETHIAWQNRPFDLPEATEENPNSTWIRETLIPGSEQLVGCDQLEVIAVMQYDVCVPSGGGTEAAEDLARSIGDAFVPGKGFTGTGPSGKTVTVSVTQSEVGLGGDLQHNGQVWYAVPVRITFRSYGQATQ